MWRLALFDTDVQILTYVKSDISIDALYKYQRVFQYKQKYLSLDNDGFTPVPKSCRKDWSQGSGCH